MFVGNILETVEIYMQYYLTVKFVDLFMAAVCCLIPVLSTSIMCKVRFGLKLWLTTRMNTHFLFSFNWYKNLTKGGTLINHVINKYCSKDKIVLYLMQRFYNILFSKIVVLSLDLYQYLSWRKFVVCQMQILSPGTMTGRYSIYAAG